ncbi:MAG: hypothetical protein LUF25_03900 [Phascolarctobacterium sp.]|nr:hypothetical protein [Phascolarctobacterium sp.]
METGSSGNFDNIITTIDNCYFYKNNATNFGGAIYNYDNAYIWNISNNIFEENTAENGNGGAIENAEKGSVIGTIANNQFLRNDVSKSDHDGGAIYNHGVTMTEVSGDTFTGNFAVSESGKAAGGAIYNSDSISTFSVTDLTGNYDEGTTSAIGGAIYDEGASEITVTGDVTGNHATASSGDAYGGAICAGEGTVVTLSGNITGNSATSTTALGGAIYNAGTVNINIEDQDAVISGNTAVSGGTEEANVLYGEAASVTNFNLTDATLRLDDSLTGETGFEINISGNGIDATTFYMYNDINDSNLSIGGTTLNTMNGEVHTYNVNQFTVSGDFDMRADINLGNETMDRFVTNGNSYGEAQGTLNVSAMNVVKDTSKSGVGIYFAEPGLKEDVTSSVSDVMGPINTYTISYDKNYYGS